MIVGLLLLLTGCLKPLVTGTPTIPAQSRQETALAPLTGVVEPFSYQVQSATLTDIASASTVSIIDTVTNLTAGTTVTDGNGNFAIHFTPGFRPSANLYYLEAYKGLPHSGVPNQAGMAVGRVRSLIRYENNQWRDLYAGEGIKISIASTALSVITSLRSASDSTQVNPVNLLDSLDAGGVFTPGISGVTNAEFDSVKGMVSQALLNDDDPLYRITYDVAGRAYFLVDRGVSVSRVYPTQGPMGTAVTVEGKSFGLAPVVRFNGAIAPSTVNSVNTVITTTVPVGATSGPVTVQVGTVVYNAANFGVTPWDGHNVFDPAGNMYVSSGLDNRIYRFDPSGNLSLYVAGAPLNYPRGLVVDPAGNVYVANYNDSKILKIDTNKTITVLATGNGLTNPVGMAINAAGDLFIANYNGQNVLKLASGSAIPAVFSTGGYSYPYGLAFDTSNNLYVSNWSSGVITKVAPDGSTSTQASGLPNPAGVALDSSGNLYVGCYGAAAIYKITPTGGILNFASAPLVGSVAMNPDGTLYASGSSYDYVARYDRTGRNQGYWTMAYLAWALKSNPTTKDLYVTSGYGYGAYAKAVYRMPFNSGTNDYDPPRRVLSGLPDPSALALYSSNRAYVGDWGGQIYDCDLITGNYSTLASGLGAIGDLAVDSSNNLYAALWSNRSLYRISNGSITRRYGGALYLNNLVLGPDGNFYCADNAKDRVLRVSPSGVISIFSDNGGAGFGGPQGLTFDGAGNLYVSGWSSNKIYKLPPSGGTATEYVSSGMSNPNGLAFDSAGNLYVSNWNDWTVKKVAAGTLTVTNYATVPNYPRSLAIDPVTNNLYVANWNGTTYKVAPNGGTGTVTTYATGTGQAMQTFFDSSNGDVLVACYNGKTIYRIPPGGGSPVQLVTLMSSAGGVAKDASGNLYGLCYDVPNLYKFPAGSTNGRLFAASLRTPDGVAISPDNQFAYVTDWSSWVVFKIDLTNGDISIASNGADWAGNIALKGITFDPAGSKLFVSSFGNGTFKLDPALITANSSAGVSVFGDNTAVSGLKGGIALGANNNLYGTAYDWINSGSSPVTYYPWNGGAGGNGLNMTNWPRYVSF